MKIAVASGKGGTGKTTLAVSLALALNGGREPPVHGKGGPGGPEGGWGEAPPLFLDCDVEAPDAHLFLQPEWAKERAVELLVPEILQDRCTLCGQCAEVCQFNALALLGEQVMVFPELCHGCGSCSLICPDEAVREVPRELGRIRVGRAGDIPFHHGLLNVGEAMAVPVIHALKEGGTPTSGQITILDAPPGTSCPMVETVKGTDFVILVTEPTPSGLHDLELAVEAVRALGIPQGVVINRDGLGDDRVEDFCRRQKIPVLLRIPFQRDIAEGMARGETLLALRPTLGQELRTLMHEIKDMVRASRREKIHGGAVAEQPVGGGGAK